MKKSFINYIENITNKNGNKFSQNSINMMIKELDELIPKELQSSKSIFDITDLLILKTIKKRLSKGGDLYEYNQKRGNGGPSKALFNYINFVETS